MKEIITFFQSSMEIPASYGWFHLMFIALTIIATVLICWRFKDCSDKTFRRLTLICWLIMIVLEVYKQITLSFSATDKDVEFAYAWYIFPFQLCSTPHFILPFIAFMKDGKLRECFTSFISTFAFFGGLVVFVYPNDVFCSTIGINIQTMVHHGLQLLTGIYFAVHFRKRLNFKYFLKAVPVFLILLAIACVLNEVVHAYLIANQIDTTFNMFYVSQYVANHLPILSAVYAAVDWVVFLIAYCFGFILAAFLVLYAKIGIINLVLKIMKKQEDKKLA